MLDFDHYLKRFWRDLNTQIRQRYSGEIRKMYHELLSQGKSKEEIEAAINEFVEPRILELGETRRVLFNQSVKKYGELRYPALMDIIVYGKEPIPYWPEDNWKKPKIVEVYRIDKDKCVESFVFLHHKRRTGRHPSHGCVVRR